MKKKFKDRYVLGVGYPWAYGTSNHEQIGINAFPNRNLPIVLAWPYELWERDVPKYRLILERVK